MDHRVRITIQYLQGGGYQSVSLGELAARVGLGTSRLEHLFKKETGSSIRDFLREMRLLRASELLTSSEARVSEICFAVGFTDASNFDHAFKLRFGVAPRRYRQFASPRMSATRRMLRAAILTKTLQVLPTLCGCRAAFPSQD